MKSCTKAVIDELMLDDQDAMQLVVAMSKTGRISADPTPENILFTKMAWRESHQVMPDFDERSTKDFIDEEKPPKLVSKPARLSQPKFRMTVFGQSISSVIRWIGQEYDITLDQARLLVDKLGGQEVKTNGIRTFLNEGKRGVGNVAKLTSDQEKQIDTLLQ